MNRDERLKAIQQAHDEFVESKGEEVPEVGESEYSDANQYGVDLEADQQEFVEKVEQATAEPEANADLTKAIDGLQALLDVLKQTQ